MGRLWGVLLLGLFAGAAFAGDPPLYLTFFSGERESQFDLENARGEHAASVELEQFAHMDFDRNTKLRKQGAISEHDLQETIMRRNVAVARTRYFAKKMTTYEAEVAHRRRNAEIASGAPVNLPALHDEYRRMWLSQCDEYKVRVDWEQANVDYAKYRYELAQELHEKKVSPEMEVLARKAEMRASEERLKMVTRVSQTCDKDLPELKNVNAMQTN